MDDRQSVIMSNYNNTPEMILNGGIYDDKCDQDLMMIMGQNTGSSDLFSSSAVFEADGGVDRQQDSYEDKVETASISTVMNN